MTAHERVIVGSAVDHLFFRLETVNNILLNVCELYFGDTEQKPLKGQTAEFVRDVLTNTTDSIWEISREYAFMMGDADFPGMREIMRDFRDFEAATRTEGLSSKAFHAVKGNEELEARRMAALRLPDGQAAAELEKLINQAQ